MDSRMEKHGYEEVEELPSRTSKNQELYHNINRSDISKIKTSNNVTIIDNAPKKIDIEKIKKYVDSLEEQVPVTRRVMINKEIEEIVPEEKQEETQKVYDINSVLEKAKEGREVYYENEKYKKLKDTQYDILSKIESPKEQEETPKEEIEFNTDEKTLIDLINTITINKKDSDLLSELKPNEENPTEEVTSPIEEMDDDKIITKEIKEEQEEINTEKNEIIKEIENANTLSQNIDKSFYTNSMSFSKGDFEGFDELEKNVKKSNKLVVFGIIMLILLGIATAYVLIKYVL